MRTATIGTRDGEEVRADLCFTARTFVLFRAEFGKDIVDYFQTDDGEQSDVGVVTVLQLLWAADMTARRVKSPQAYELTPFDAWLDALPEDTVAYLDEWSVPLMDELQQNFMKSSAKKTKPVKTPAKKATTKS